MKVLSRPPLHATTQSNRWSFPFRFACLINCESFSLSGFLTICLNKDGELHNLHVPVVSRGNRDDSGNTQILQIF
jgi:hypothetical protein